MSPLWPLYPGTLVVTESGRTNKAFTTLPHSIATGRLISHEVGTVIGKAESFDSHFSRGRSSAAAVVDRISIPSAALLVDDSRDIGVFHSLLTLLTGGDVFSLLSVFDPFVLATSPPPLPSFRPFFLLCFQYFPPRSSSVPREDGDKHHLREKNFFLSLLPNLQKVSSSSTFTLPSVCGLSFYFTSSFYSLSLLTFPNAVSSLKILFPSSLLPSPVP